MSEADGPTAFTRGSRVRASLPVVRSTNQTKDRSLGKLCIAACCLFLTTKCFNQFNSFSLSKCGIIYAIEKLRTY